MKQTLKFGKIELYRFIFCICVLFFHFGKYFKGLPEMNGQLHLEFFPHGAMGVEFFFLLSGFFMAKSIYKKVEKEKNVVTSYDALSKEYIGFIKHKYLRVFPKHMVIFLITFIVYVVVYHCGLTKCVELAIKNIPAFFLIQMSGINFHNVLHIEWYVSCMLISMAIVYPICRKYYYTFTRWFAPLVCLLVLGFLQYTTGSLTGVSIWIGVTYKSMIRAIVEISLGTTCYEVSRYLSSHYFGKNKKITLLFSLIEASAFLLSMSYIVSSLEVEYEIYVLGLMFILIAISTSGVSFGMDFFNKRIFYFLGKISFLIYLSQLAAIYIISETMPGLRFGYQVLSGIILVILFVLLTEILSRPIEKMVKKYE